MNNEEIITRIAVSNGIFSEEEINRMIAEGKEIPIHTFRGWKDRGMSVRKGEHGIECKLWKHKNKKTNDNENEDTDDFYLTKSYLFTLDQTEKEEMS